MATPISKKLYITTVNALPSIQEMSDIESDPNASHLRTQFQEVKSADQLRAAAGQAQGYYSGLVNRYQPGDSYRTTIEAAAAKQGFYGQDLSKLSDEQLFAGLKGAGYYGGDVNTGLNYLRGAQYGSDYVTLSPEEMQKYGFQSSFASKASYDQAIKNEADLAAGLIRPVIENGKTVGYVPVGSPADLKLQGKDPTTSKLPEFQDEIKANAVDTNLQMKPGEAAEQYTARVAQYQQGGAKLTPTPETNPSLVDFLNSIGMPSDAATRARLAQERGITGYFVGEGNAAMNERLLAMLRKEYASGTLGGTAKTETPSSTTKSSTTTGTTGTPNPQAEMANIDAEANKLMQEELARIARETTKVDLSKSAELVEKLTKMLDEPQKQPSLSSQFAEQRAKLGVEPLEAELSSLDAEIDQLDADYASAVEGEEGRQVSMSQVRRRQSAEGIQYSRAKRDLVAQRDSVARELNTKLGVIESMVKYAGMDADNARQDYQMRFTQAVSAANLMKGIEDSAKSDQERRADNARANIQIMYNLIKDGNIDPSKMDAQSLANLRVMEVQAGLPSGFTSLISKTIDEPIVTFGSEYTNSSGERVQPVYTRDKATGAVTAKNVVLGQAKPEPNTTETKGAQEDDIATVILDFQDKMQKNSWAGANPDAYDYYKSQLIKMYGASAALALDKAMLDAGIIVDRQNK